MLTTETLQETNGRILLLLLCRRPQICINGLVNMLTPKELSAGRFVGALQSYARGPIRSSDEEESSANFHVNVDKSEGKPTRIQSPDVRT